MSLPAAFDVDDLLWTNFRVTRSGRAFSPWDSAPISTAFTIATAVSQAVNSQAEEDLAEPDSGDSNNINPPFLAPDNTPLNPTKTPSRRTRDKAGSKLRRHNARQAEKLSGPPSSSLNSAPRRQDGLDCATTAPNFPGFTLGKYLGPDARPILDGTGKVFAVHAGRPDDPNWMRDVHDPAVKAMEEARAQCKVSEERSYHRRGNWPPLSAGDSHGGGQLQPACSIGHRDFANLAFGWCAITALGDYDFTKGGHVPARDHNPYAQRRDIPLEHRYRTQRASVLLHPVHGGGDLSLD
ncbi:hypothetical protein C8R46DRAFT_1226585 [Mycena filopes]|nr:hypothetical protein C8R46DRAFT_1226585 [Mycena filopes]